MIESALPRCVRVRALQREQIAAFEGDGAGQAHLRREQAKDRQGGGRFPASGLADESQRLALINAEIQ